MCEEFEAYLCTNYTQFKSIMQNDIAFKSEQNMLELVIFLGDTQVVILVNEKIKEK